MCFCHSAFYEQNDGAKCCFQPGNAQQSANEARTIKFETEDFFFFDASLIKTSEGVIVLVARCRKQGNLVEEVGVKTKHLHLDPTREERKITNKHIQIEYIWQYFLSLCRIQHQQ